MHLTPRTHIKMLGIMVCAQSPRTQGESQEIPQGKSPGQRETFASKTWQVSSEE